MAALTLPKEEVEILLNLSETDKFKFCHRLRLLQHIGWTYRELATALGRSSSTIQYWIAEAQPDALMYFDDVPAPDRAPKDTEIVRFPVKLSEFDQKMFKSLAKTAKNANRHSTPDTKEHLASTMLNHLLIQQNREKMVPVTVLAEATGLSKAAISARLKKTQ